jgi:hypothetical protein
MQNKTDLSLSIMGLIIFASLGAVIGLVVGFGVTNLASRGIFSSWKLIKSPVGFSRITGAGSHTIWAESGSQLYFYDLDCSFFSKNCKEWVVNEKIPPNSGNIQKGEKCPAWSPRPKNTPPGKLIVCALSNRVNGEFSYYALQEDGTVWYWKIPSRNDSRTTNILFGIIGLTTGIVLDTVLRRGEKDQYKQAIVNVISLVLTMIAFAIICSIIGLFIGIGIEFLPSTGVFTSWELLDSPVKFSQIADINADGVIWAQTTDGNLYRWENWCYNSPETCKQWIETENVPSNAHEGDFRPMSKGKNCTKNDGLPGREPPGKVVECASIAMKNGPALSDIYYALLEDGTIWYWFPPAGTDYPIISLQIGPSIGLLMGVIAGVFLTYLRAKKNKQ